MIIMEVFMANKLESDVQAKMMRTIRKYGGYVYKNAQVCILKKVDLI